MRTDAEAIGANGCRIRLGLFFLVSHIRSALRRLTATKTGLFTSCKAVILDSLIIVSGSCDVGKGTSTAAPGHGFLRLMKV